MADWWRCRCTVDEPLVARGEQVLGMAEMVGDVGTLALVRWHTAILLIISGELEQADTLAHSALADAQRAGDAVLGARCRVALGLLYRRRLQIEEIHANALHCLEVAERLDLSDCVGAANADLAWAAWRRADTAQAEAHGLRAIASWEQSTIAYPFQWAALLPLLALNLNRGLLNEAVAYGRALLSPLQQQLPGPVDAALARAITAFEQARPRCVRKYLHRTLALSCRSGLL